MEKQKIYAKILNPEWYDYRVYEDCITESDDLIIEGGREWTSFNTELVKRIENLINDYLGWDYEHYYNNSIKAYLNDMLPNKSNGKKLSPKEIHTIKQLLDDCGHNNETETIISILSIFKCEPYEVRWLKGCCQGECVKLYCPVSTSNEMSDYIEAWYFATGNEVEIHDCDSEVNEPDDIEGYTFYTSSWKVEDIKNEVLQWTNSNPNETEVVLYKFDGYIKTPKYKLV